MQKTFLGKVIFKLLTIIYILGKVTSRFFFEDEFWKREERVISQVITGGLQKGGGDKYKHNVEGRGGGEFLSCDSVSHTHTSEYAPLTSSHSGLMFQEG